MQYHVVGSESFVSVHAHAHASEGPFALSVPIMEQIETQVSDLRYLSQAPVPLGSGGPDAAGSAASAYETPRPQGHGSPGSASVGDNSAPSVHGGASNSHGNASVSAGSKRKSLDDGSVTGKGTRSKRNRVSLVFHFCRCCGEAIMVGARFALWRDGHGWSRTTSTPSTMQQTESPRGHCLLVMPFLLSKT